MKTKNIHTKLENTNEIFDRCNLIFQDIKFLSNANKQEAEIINESTYLLRQLDLSWRMLIIELYKLFKKEEHHSIPKLLNILIYDYPTICKNYKYDLQKIKNYQLQLKEKKFEDAIKTVENLREKYIAHLDNNRNEYSDSIKTNQVEILINYSQKLLPDIFDLLNKNDYPIIDFRFSDLKSFVNKISELNETET